MRVEAVETRKGSLFRCRAEGGERVASTGDFLELMANCPSGTIVLDCDTLDPAFFDLKSGLAGEILQKASNYRRRLVVLGDFSAAGGRALGDFIYESNRTGQIVFAADLETAVELLR
jgi:hypothetical protein